MKGSHTWRTLITRRVPASRNRLRGRRTAQDDEDEDEVKRSTAACHADVICPGGVPLSVPALDDLRSAQSSRPPADLALIISEWQRHRGQ